MQKKLLALAIAGLAATPALADDNVTIYGRVDVGYLNRGDGDGAVADPGSKSEIASGIAGGSRIGFRGTEDLGNGLKALFEVNSASLWIAVRSPLAMPPGRTVTPMWV